MLIHNIINKQMEYLIIPKEDFKKHISKIELYITDADKNIIQISPSTYKEDETISSEYKKHIDNIKIDYATEILFFIVKTIEKEKKLPQKKEKDIDEYFLSRVPRMDKVYKSSDIVIKRKEYTKWQYLKFKLKRLLYA